MLSIAPPPTIYLHSGASGMRKSFDGLSGIIRGNFGGDPADGSLFLFVNRRRDRIKALWWDGDGFVLWYKRLEQGTFETVPSRSGEERVQIDSTQLAMVLGGVRLERVSAEGIADVALETIRSYERRKQAKAKPRNEQLPAHLPRYEVKLDVPLDVPEDQKICAEHGERQVVGFDWQETLEFVPATLIVRRTGIPKLACSKAPECGVVEAQRPVGLVEGNRYDTSVAAEIIFPKYAYQLPVYRQQDFFASCGWTPARSTLLNVLEAAANCIRPLVEHLREAVRAGPMKRYRRHDSDARLERLSTTH